MTMSVDTTELNFADRVIELVRQIPSGRVMSYGQIAALAGSPVAARIVGGIAHYGDPDIPWQRVVNKRGGLASGYPGGLQGHCQALEAEGIKVSSNYIIAIDELRWWPVGYEVDVS